MARLSHQAKKLLPFLARLPTYNWACALQDILAGFTVGLMVVPQAIAFASIAGMPPQYGLYSAFMSSIVYAFLGTIDVLVVGPTTLMALIISPFTSKDPGYSPLFSLINGVVITSCAVFQLGFLVDFVSHPVTSGFSSAASITIASSQLKNLLGINITDRVSQSWPGLMYTYANLGINVSNICWPDALLGLGCLVILTFIKYLPKMGQKCRPSVKKVLWYLSVSRNAIVFLVCTLASTYTDTPFKLTGEVPSGLPPVSLPNYGLESDFGTLLSEVSTLIFTLPLLTILVQMANAKAFSKGKSVDASQEMLALGLSNLAGSFVCGMPVTTSFGRTAVNAASGARTPFGGIITALVTIAALLFLMPFCANIPTACLAAVIVGSVIFQVDLSICKRLWQSSRWDLIPYSVTVLGCLLYRLEYGILMGIGVNAFELLYISARPQLNFTIEDERLKVLVDSGLTYPSANHLQNTVQRYIDKHGNDTCITLDLSRLTTLDFTTATVIADMVNAFREQQRMVTLTGLRANLQDYLEKVSGVELAKDTIDIETKK